MAEEVKQDFSQTGGQILTFISDEKVYAFKITDVTDIIEIPEITFIPRTPDYIPGVINLRGKVVPVIDLRRKLGSPDFEYDAKSCMILVESGVYQAGVLVDRVNDVENVIPAQIAQNPVKDSTESCFITSSATKDRISLLNTRKLIKD
ncbi:MAG: chemotaxis protein CheW [Ruminococcus sp.]|nr:chemotaxis protein CheW [Ruminococcus sp.]MBQ7069979.1 chemotaxis protein CheW [Ruminococcus sp.]